MDTNQLATEFKGHHDAVLAALRKQDAESTELKVALDGRLGALEQQLARSAFNGGFSAEADTWGGVVCKSAGYKALAATQSGKVRIPIELKTTITTSSTSGGPLAPSDRQPGPNLLPRKRIRFRDALMAGRTNSTSVEYPRQTTRTSAAASVVEGSAKPESALAWETVTAPVRTIATVLPASKQILDDSQVLLSVVDGELRYMLADVEEAQLLMGDGTGVNLNGVYTQATAFSPPFTMAAPDMIGVLLLAIAQTQAAGFEPDSITVNPLDWARIIATKNDGGDYLGNGPFSAEQVARLWSIPVIPTLAMTQDKFMVGSSVGAQVFDRQDATVEISTEHSDFFAKNLCLLRAELRVALCVCRATAFTKGDFSDAITASTTP